MKNAVRCLAVVAFATFMVCGATGCDVGVATITFPLGDNDSADFFNQDNLEQMGIVEGAAFSFQSSGVGLCELPTSAKIQTLLAEQMGGFANVVSIQKVVIKKIRCQSQNTATFSTFKEISVLYRGPDENGKVMETTLAGANSADGAFGKEVDLTGDATRDFFVDIKNAEQYLGQVDCPTARAEVNGNLPKGDAPTWKMTVYADVYLAVLK